MTKTAVALPVYATSGGEISGLEISPADGSDRKPLTTGEPSSTPSSTSTSNASETEASSTSASATQASNSASATADSAAGKIMIADGAAVVGLVGMALFAL